MSNLKGHVGASWWQVKWGVWRCAASISAKKELTKSDQIKGNEEKACKRAIELLGELLEKI